MALESTNLDYYHVYICGEGGGLTDHYPGPDTIELYCTLPFSLKLFLSMSEIIREQ